MCYYGELDDDPDCTGYASCAHATYINQSNGDNDIRVYCQGVFVYCLFYSSFAMFACGFFNVSQTTFFIIFACLFIILQNNTSHFSIMHKKTFACRHPFNKI